MNKLEIIDQLLNDINNADPDRLLSLQSKMDDSAPLPWPYTSLEPYRDEVKKATKVFSLIETAVKAIATLPKALV